MSSLIKSCTFLSLLLIGCFVFPNQLAAQHGWEKTLGSVYGEPRLVLEGQDNSILIFGEDVSGFETLPSDSMVNYIIKYNELGDQIFSKFFEYGRVTMHAFKTTNQTLIGYYGKDIPSPDDQERLFMFEMNLQGEMIWESMVDPDLDLHGIEFASLLPDGRLFFVGLEEQGTSDFSRGIISPTGQLITYEPIPNSHFSDKYITKSNGGFYQVTIGISGFLEVLEYDEDLNLINSDSHANIIGTLIGESILLEDGDIVLFHFVNSILYQTRIDVVQGVLYSNVIGEFGVSILSTKYTSAGILHAGLIYGDPSGLEQGMMMMTDFDGQVVWQKRYSHLPGAQLFFDAMPYNDGYVAVGFFRGGFQQSYFVSTDESGNIYQNSISGKVALDANENCILNLGELAIEDWLIYAEKGEQTFVQLSDELGQFTIPLDTGQYEISILPPNSLWLPCENEIQIELPVIDTHLIQNFSIQTDTICPELEVNITVPTLQPCLEYPGYVSYCNFGTDTAYAAYIDLTFDSLLTPISSTIPWESLSNNVYRFQIGDVEPLECNDFDLSIFLDCEASLGLSYCVEAYAYPDIICQTDSSLWSGAYLEASGNCDGDNVVLRIQNTGDGNMTDYSNYIVIEDILLFQLDSVHLNAGEFVDIPVPANGSTYTLIAEQVEDAPGFSYPIAVVEGCGTNDNGLFTSGLGNQFQMNDSDPYRDTDCPVAIESINWNSAQSFPTGYQNENYIFVNTPIEYLLNFRNTGSDTLESVIFRDTLDRHFDLASLSYGASNYEYNVELEGERILKFSFENIQLPPAAQDESASNVFVEFKISAKSETPNGTMLRNRAAFYFDLKEPIVTNETFHTIGEAFIEIMPSSVNHPLLNNIEISVYPNPFESEVVLEIKNHPNQIYRLEIIDLQGRNVRSGAYESNKIIFQRNNLISGLYIYKITADDGFQHAGTIVVR